MKEYFIKIKNHIIQIINKTEDIKFSLFIHLLCLICFLIGYFQRNFNIGLLAVTLVFIYNIVYCLSKFYKKLIFLCFNFMMFLFLLSRPIISFFKGNTWWYFSQRAVWMSLITLLIALIGLFYGYYISFNAPAEKEVKKESNIRLSIKYIHFALLVIFLGCCICSLAIEAEKFISMKGASYEALYLGYSSRFPSIIRIVGDMMPYAFCAYLATFPSKREAFIPFAMYIGSALPTFILGNRSLLMLHIVFAFAYYCLRDILKNATERLWLGKIEKIVIVAMLPIVIIGLGAFNYIRADEELPTSSLSGVMLDFFYKQGTSFDTLCQIYENKDYLPANPYKNYTYGKFLDYATHSTIAQKLFGTKGLPDGNNIENATKSNVLAHHVSYLVLKDQYLEGNGRGSSFIGEVFLDYSYPGVAIYCLLFGYFLGAVPRLLRKNWLLRVMILIILSECYLIPRDAATGFLMFIVTPQFWIVIIGGVIMSYLCKILVEKTNLSVLNKLIK